MAESCTIYCTVLNLDEIARLLHSHFPSSRPTVGNSMTVHGSDGSLRFTQKVFRERGDDFCRLLLATCAFVEDISNADAVVKKRLASHVESCELVLGVVAEPAFEADERYHAGRVARPDALGWAWSLVNLHTLRRLRACHTTALANRSERPMDTILTL